MFPVKGELRNNQKQSKLSETWQNWLIMNLFPPSNDDTVSSKAVSLPSSSVWRMEEHLILFLPFLAYKGTVATVNIYPYLYIFHFYTKLLSIISN